MFEAGREALGVDTVPTPHVEQPRSSQRLELCERGQTFRDTCLTERAAAASAQSQLPAVLVHGFQSIGGPTPPLRSRPLPAEEFGGV